MMMMRSTTVVLVQNLVRRTALRHGPTSSFSRSAAVRSLTANSETTPSIKATTNPSSQATAIDDEWIAPDRPLIGDLGQTHLYAQQQAGEEEEDEEAELQRIATELERLEQESVSRTAVERLNTHTNQNNNTVDWLATRRSKLSPDSVSSSEDRLMKQSDARQKLRELSDIIVKKDTYLSSLEIQTCVEALGGSNVVIAETQPGHGNILVTANTNQQLRAIAETLVRHLRKRDLHLMGVVGAELGVEGADDPNETWLVVDAGNYVIHLQDRKTRKAVNLEALWFGTDGLKRVNAMDEEAVEDYIAANPVPDDYNVSISRDWDETMKELQKQRWTVPHRPVVPKSKTKARRRFRR